MWKTHTLATMTTTWVPTAPATDTFGARLRVLRLAMDDLSIKEMAMRCGFPPATWRTWEKKGTSPHNMAAVAEKIHQTTGADRDWLMWGTPSVGSPKGAYVNTAGHELVGAAA